MGTVSVLIVDNYDSFAFNLAQAFWTLGATVEVVRNDAISVREIGERMAESKTSHLVLSPGPKGPDQAGIGVDAVRTLHGKLPILGVCLGHQCIIRAFGAPVRRVGPVHGKASAIGHTGSGIFSGIPSPMQAARYHSLGTMIDELPRHCLRPTAWLENGPPIAMAVEAVNAPTTVGVQFHPESYLTPEGPRLLANFLALRVPMATVHAETAAGAAV